MEVGDFGKWGGEGALVVLLLFCSFFLLPTVSDHTTVSII